MSKSTKQMYKQYKIETIQDACSVLASLITGVIVNLDKYKEYTLEAEMCLRASTTDFISAKDYDNIDDKLKYRQHELLRYLADRQKSSFSYVDTRELFMKKKYLANPLSDEINQILKELGDIRNWTFHNPQSLMVASKEVAEKRIPPELKDLIQIRPQLNPVIVTKVQEYELKMLASLVFHANSRIEMFENVLNCMKADYQEMINQIEPRPMIITDNGMSSEIQYIDNYIVGKFDDPSNDVIQISMAIQKSKYDGSDKKYKEWTIGNYQGSQSEENR